MTGLVFIVTNLLLAWFGYKLPGRSRAREAAYWHDNPRLEWTWTLVTAVILAIFLFNALGLWAQVNAPPPADAMLIEVTGQQFAWNIRYPGKDGVLGRTDHLVGLAGEPDRPGQGRSRVRGRRPPPEPALPAAGQARYACRSARWT